MLTAQEVVRANAPDQTTPVFDTITLPHDERHLRRKRLVMESGEALMVDLPQTVHLGHGDLLLVTDDKAVAVRAAIEPLTEIHAKDPTHHAALCWHIGNRHLKAQIEPDRILILRDPVIHTMLEGLGAHLHLVDEPFHPVHGAYHSHYDHGHGHAHSHEQEHSHG
ncbi:MAG: urease accessory protein UreE [Pseudomonadota bacterium]